MPIITYLGLQNISKTAKYFSFDAASSLQVNNNEYLYVYSTSVRARNKIISMGEFYSNHNLKTSSITKRKAAFLELYEKEELKGRCLRIYGELDSDI